MSKRQASPRERGYDDAHRRARANAEHAVARGGVRCARGADCFWAELVAGRWVGGFIEPGSPWDLGHVDGDKSRYAGVEHRRCNRATSGRRWAPEPAPELEPERVGLDRRDERFDVPWLKALRRIPRDAVWPRYMTVPHPRAVASLGPEFIREAERRSGRKLRWFQRLVATRLLEVDAAGELVWETLVLSMARQLGKSWLLRELILWRMHQAARFGEPQDIMHTGKDLLICREVIRPAMFWADERPGYKVSRAAGDQSIEHVADHSRWLLRARGGVYGYSVSLGAVDEAWKVRPEIVDEGLAPTMVERVQPQLLLISTAHRLASPLMLTRRKVALDNLELGDGDLLIEWSAPRDAELADRKAWRAASPHWTAKRERLISKQLEAVLAGEGELTEDEADPVESFRAQWLNQWPARTIPLMLGEPLLPAGLWAFLEEPIAEPAELHVALEDNFGNGAAVAACAVLADGRFELDGWLCVDWDAALDDVYRLGRSRRISELLVGASLLNRVPPDMTPPPVASGRRETTLGLALIRDLAANQMLVHDRTRELDDALAAAQVKELSTGLRLEPSGPTHLVRAAVWALHAAHKPAPVPAIY